MQQIEEPDWLKSAAEILPPGGAAAPTAPAAGLYEVSLGSSSQGEVEDAEPEWLRHPGPAGGGA